MNPYASQLGGRDPLTVISETPGELSRLLGAIGPERSTEPLAPGKWSAREILAHLADTELAFGFRLRQAVAEEHHVIQPFDQDVWDRWYSAVDAATALATFSAVRAWNVAFLRSVLPDAYDRPVTHPERGEMTFRTLVETMGGHDLNHVKQIASIAARGAGA
jgi:hypothetical protein